MTNASGTSVPKHVTFAALRDPTYRMYFATATLAMMADNIEHVLTYWVLYQTFHSPGTTKHTAPAGVRL